MASTGSDATMTAVEDQLALLTARRAADRLAAESRRMIDATVTVVNTDGTRAADHERRRDAVALYHCAAQQAAVITMSYQFVELLDAFATRASASLDRLHIRLRVLSAKSKAVAEAYCTRVRPLLREREASAVALRRSIGNDGSGLCAVSDACLEITRFVYDSCQQVVDHRRDETASLLASRSHTVLRDATERLHRCQLWR